MRLVVAIIRRNGKRVSTGSIKGLGEVFKLVLLNVVANVVPLAIDSKNSAHMLIKRESSQP